MLVNALLFNVKTPRSPDNTAITVASAFIRAAAASRARFLRPPSASSGGFQGRFATVASCYSPGELLAVGARVKMMANQKRRPLAAAEADERDFSGWKICAAGLQCREGHSGLELIGMSRTRCHPVGVSFHTNCRCFSE